MTKSTNKLISVAGIAVLTTLIIDTTVDVLTGRLIPSTSRVQEGYVKPRDVSVFVKDNDTSDGERLPETYMKVGTNTYVLRYDTHNRPLLSEYDVLPSTPSRVVVKEQFELLK